MRIKYNLHKHLHNTKYYNAVNNLLKKADGSYNKVKNVLAYIKVVLTVASNSSKQLQRSII